MMLDLSDKATGYAIGTPGNKPEVSGTITPRGGGETNVWLSTTEDLKQLCRKYEIGQVCFSEFVHTPHVYAARANLGLRAMVMVEIGRMGIHVKPVHEISYRKALGVYLGRTPTSDEQADFERRLAKYRLRKKKSKNLPKPKMNMKARVAARLAELGWTEGDDNEKDAVVLLMAHNKVKPQV